jgi:hypothetical protein
MPGASDLVSIYIFVWISAYDFISLFGRTPVKTMTTAPITRSVTKTDIAISFPTAPHRRKNFAPDARAVSRDAALVLVRAVIRTVNYSSIRIIQLTVTVQRILRLLEELYVFVSTRFLSNSEVRNVPP